VNDRVHALEDIKLVQLVHRRIARIQKTWPRQEPPGQPASLMVMDALCAGTDAKKDELIRIWMTTVWECWGACRSGSLETTDERV
jgi:hypothetical protein